MDKKIIVGYAEDQTASIEGMPQMRHEDGYPYSINDCIRWCKNHGYKYEVRVY